MVIIHFLAFATVSVLHSESMPSKPTQAPKEELRPFFTNLGTRMRAKDRSPDDRSSSRKLCMYSVNDVHRRGVLRGLLFFVDYYGAFTSIAREISYRC